MSAMSNLSNEKLMRILYFPRLIGILVRPLFVLCLLALAGTQGVSAQSLPSCTTSLNIPNDNDGVPQPMDIDKDGDGLIEICDLEGLDEMRYQLDGMGYKTTDSEMVAAITAGCSTTCSGFELMRDLDFEDPASYRSGSTNQAWTGGAGWNPIGVSAFDSFGAIFDGNGYTISNLLINRLTNDGVGFFRSIAITGRIDNMRLKDVDVTGRVSTAGLAGVNFGTINDAYVSGTITGTGDNVGGLVGNNIRNCVINNSYAVVTVSGGTGNRVAVGGLVGANSCTITNSYAIAYVSGNEGVGGLVGTHGINLIATIRNSFAIATVRGNKFVGGLAGALINGRIFNGYARGSVFGTDTDVGGLVGWMGDSGGLQRINNSYSIAEVAGDATTIGGLVGRRSEANALINNSYWDSQISGQDTSDGGTGKTTVELQSPTTNEGIYANWSTDDWDFGSSTQFPIPKAFGSDTLLPNQRIGLRGLQTSTINAEFVPTFTDAITRYAITIPYNTSSIDLTLTAYNSTATIEVIKEGEATDYFAGRGSRGSVSIPIATNPVLIITVQEPELDPIVYQVVVTSLPPCALNIPDNDGDGVEQAMDIDKDGNGLIEICDLEGLNAIRHQPDGTGYQANAGATKITDGCPSNGCTGYELTRNLDFNNNASYRTIANMTTWTTGNGWQPIAGFNATFNGDGYTISNLMINRNGTDGVGLFGHTGSNSTLTAVGLLNVDISGQNRVGGLVGNNASVITNSYATGTVLGIGIRIGGLAGENGGNAIIKNSCATSAVSKTGTVSGVGNPTGGLVGLNQGTITNSCATGTVSGGGSRIGGLVGQHQGGTIENSYATGSVSGTGNQIGGLVGQHQGGTIENSYATGSVSGIGISVGGLVGATLSGSAIMKSYATGSVSGSFNVGGLVGLLNTGGTISNSYWLSSSASSGGTNVSANTEKTVMELISPTAAEGIYSTWSTSDWDFGTSNQFPIIRNSGSDVLTNFLPVCTLNILADDRDDVKHAMDVDKDNDNLIEICDLEGLDEMRYQLDGMGYKTTDSEMVAAITTGCSTTCTGFELARNLDFMASDSYRPATNEATWTTGGGWQPVGDLAVLFDATFDGNGHTISNLMINKSDTTLAGLFGYTETSAEIANLGLLDVNIRGVSSVGGLAGWNQGSITGSYVTGTVSGTNRSVGGLVGSNQGRITRSYATSTVSGTNRNVGGLVGFNDNATIENSYATGSVSGTSANVGGLVGLNQVLNNSQGTIANSYVTAKSVSGNNDVGGLAGRNTGTINDSYWRIGSTSSAGTGVATDTSKTTVELTSPTGAEGIYAEWEPDDWDFGNSNQFPALKYAKGTDTSYQACSDTPPQTGIDQPQCGTLLPHQGMNIGDRDGGLRESLRELDISGAETELNMPFGVSTNNYVVRIFLREGINEGSVVLRLRAYNPDAEIQIFKAGDSTDYFTGKMSGDESLPIAVVDGTKLTIRVSEPDTDYTLTFRVEEIQDVSAQSLPPCTTSLNIPDDNDGIPQAMDIDKDGDGLIEICDLEGLDEMRHQLDGSGYTTSTNAMKITTGCPTTCSGFELMRDLDFEDPASYRSGSTNQAWTSGAGWDPIGVSVSNDLGVLEFDDFRAIFDGNGYAISNLLINRPSNVRVGFFRGITERIDNMRLKNVDVIGGVGTGGLAGANLGTINNAYVSGTITGTANTVGGLVGDNFQNCLINNSYAVVTVSGGTGNRDVGVGGLVGDNGCTITNSYAIADVSGNEGVGGLVGGHGINLAATIRNSFAIATVRGNRLVGGLVGVLINGRIFNGYARGSVFATNTDVGGLVGVIFNAGPQRINNSYSVVEVASGTTATTIGGLVGRRSQANTLVNNSYWDSQISGQDTSDGGISKTTMELQSPTTNEGIYANWSTDDWDFGSTEQYPRLKYVKGTDSDNPACYEDAGDSDTGLPQCGDLLSDQDNFLPQCTFSLNIPDDNDGVLQAIDTDKDNDGLIEICDLERLNAIRHQLDGTGYKASAEATVITDGCPSTCTGFELTRSLDFMDTSSYGSGNINTVWTQRQGWQPIGVSGASFSATFDGNGYTISNLMINRNGTDGVGLFGYTGSNSTLTAVGLLNVDISGQNRVGGLVGNNAGVITNSYVTGTVLGTGSQIGGLVGGSGTNAIIKNSCATASVSRTGTVSGVGNPTGGLVGLNQGTITNSCATGTVSGVVSRIGGLVGQHQGGTIENSYATGSVSGTRNQIGGLVGFNDNSTIENSYATGSVSGTGISVGGLVGATFSGSVIMKSYATGSVSGSFNVGGLVGLLNTDGTISNSYWLSGSASSGGTGVNDTNTKKTVMELISPTAAEGIYSTWSTSDWDFGTSNQFPVIKDSGSDILTNFLPVCTLNILADDRDDVKHAMDVDKDNDGLIEICDLEGLDEMRHQLDGMGYKTTPNATVITTGCSSTGCKGYELARSLDFMASDSYRPATNEATWTTGGGWQPVGDLAVLFEATFDGNGHTISNLMINKSDTTLAGLFGYTETSAEIANLGLLDVNIRGVSSVGGLVGWNQGSITGIYVTGTVSGTNRSVGGLVGSNQGRITRSYATSTVSGTNRNVGGLVGFNDNATIENSYATGSVSGTSANVGGLVGFNDNATIENSYVTAKSVSGNNDVGGLAGENTGTINDSYWRIGSTSSAGTGVATDTSKTTVELTSPTGAEGIYAEWEPDDWNFGNSNQFPALKYAKGTDTSYQACSDTPPQTGIDQPQCGTLLPHQGMNIGDRDGGLRESLRELDISGAETELNMPFGVSTNNYVVRIFLREGINEGSVVLRLRAYNPDAEIQIFKAGDSTDYFTGKMSGDESLPIAVVDGTKLTIRVSEPDTDYTLTFRVEEIRGIQIRVKVFLEGPLQ